MRVSTITAIITDNVYYFSPEASMIAIATKAFQTFDVTPCAEKPNLEGCEKVTIS